MPQAFQFSLIKAAYGKVRISDHRSEVAGEILPQKREKEMNESVPSRFHRTFTCSFVISPAVHGLWPRLRDRMPAHRAEVHESQSASCWRACQLVEGNLSPDAFKSRYCTVFACALIVRFSEGVWFLLFSVVVQMGLCDFVFLSLTLVGFWFMACFWGYQRLFFFCAGDPQERLVCSRGYDQRYCVPNRVQCLDKSVISLSLMEMKSNRQCSYWKKLEISLLERYELGNEPFKDNL